ncbi:hypothetical protein [Mesorhizobium sp.]|nr:hypothetical protein [Mesorhizobium sp.]
MEISLGYKGPDNGLQMLQSGASSITIQVVLNRDMGHHRLV